MGRKKNRLKNVDTLALQTDKEGNLQYDMVIRQGQRDGKVVHTKFDDLKEKDVKGEEEWARPDDEAIAEATRKTKEALDKIVQGTSSCL